jgi:hypothetical protein
MSVIVTSGQVTISNLADAPVLNCYVTATQATTQTYSADSGAFNPSYASTAQVLTLNLVKAGDTTNTSLLPNISGTVAWTRSDGGAAATAITSTVSTDTQYLSGTGNSVLTTKVNVPTATNTNYSRFTATGTWIDPNTGLSVPFSAYIDITKTNIATAADVISVYTPNGNAFRNNSTPSNLTINADLYKNGALSTQNKQINWFYYDTTVTATTSTGYDAKGGLSWHLCSSTTTGQTPNVAANTNTTGQGILTVTPGVINTTQMFKVVVTDEGATNAGTSLSQVVLLFDYSDPISINIQAKSGTVFKNGSGSTVLYAQLIQNGAEIDAAGTAYTYTWTSVTNTGTTNSLFTSATGKSITVTESNVTGLPQASFICTVTQ